MSMSSALSNALSGLTATGRRAEVVSSNVANATTEGYGVRRLTTTAQILDGRGGGVRVTGVARHADMVLIGQRRDAAAAQGAANTLADALTRLEAQIGTPDDPGSLSGQLDDFEARLISAANRPDSQPRLAALLEGADRLAEKLNSASDGIQTLRLEADTRISQSIDSLNRSLSDIEDLNGRIRVASGGGRDTSALLDRQQALIDGIADLVPLRETRDRFGQVTLYTSDGLSLLDGKAARFEFTAVTVMEADLTRQGGDLSGITLNGQALSLDGSYPFLQGGTLGALFTLRDNTAVAAQARLDGVAFDLAARFDDPGLDATRAPNDPGLFTDGGQKATAANEVGLAGRLRVNAAVDPDRGGALWRLRDGVGAVTEGSAANPALLQASLDALQAARPTVSAAFSGAARTMAELGAEMLSRTGVARQSAQTDQGIAAARHTLLREAELRGGVDTDHEMQQLLLIEQAYAANARLIQTVGELINQLMRI